MLVDPPSEPRLERRTGELDPDRDAWASILETRDEARIGVREVLRYGAEVTLPLSGTEKGERDSTVLVVLARVDGEPCLVVGQDRSRQGPAKPMGPGALRTARRAMRLANEIRLPFVTVIDTPGAELSQRAEEGAIAGEIARCLASLVTMTVPTVSVLLGQGCGGGALALLPAQHVIAAERAWVMPLPPEGASVIVHGDTEHAAEQARRDAGPRRRPAGGGHRSSRRTGAGRGPARGAGRGRGRRDRGRDPAQPSRWTYPPRFGPRSLNRAPCGSVSSARRPYGESSAARSTVPPASSATATVASVSSTAK